MRVIVVLYLFMACVLSAQAQTSIPPPVKRNNIKISMAQFEASYAGSPILFNTQTRSYTLEYERFIKNRFALTFTPTYRFFNYNTSNTATSETTSNYFELGFGYNYYLIQFKNNTSFNGFYSGLSVFGGNGTYKQVRNGRISSLYRSNTAGAGLKLGIQTIVFKRLSLSIEGMYRTNMYFNNNRNNLHSFFNTQLKVGFAF